MRRFVLVFMMLLLPLQWSWAAAASVCEHERDATHLGHHEHKHGGADEAQKIPADDGDGQPPGKHPDCHACHGMGAVCLTSPTCPERLWAERGPLPGYGRFLPEPPVQSLLRPPLSLVA